MDQVIDLLNSIAGLLHIPIISGVVGVIGGVLAPVLGAIGVIKYTKNDVLGNWAYQAGVKANKWCVKKLGKSWEPIENKFRPALKIIADQFLKGMKDTV